MHSVYNGTESLSFLGPKIWELVPEDAKQSGSLDVFKNKIKKWVPSRIPEDIAKLLQEGVIIECEREQGYFLPAMFR